MSWEDFKQLKELLMQVNLKLAQQNSHDTNSVKNYTAGSVYAIALVPVFNTLQESHFGDLTYRYVATDAELTKVKNNLESLYENV